MNCESLDRAHCKLEERYPARRRDLANRDSRGALRLAGGPKPTLPERAVALTRERGEVRTAELTAIGIPRCYLTRMCDEGLLGEGGLWTVSGSGEGVIAVGHGRPVSDHSASSASAIP